MTIFLSFFWLLVDKQNYLKNMMDFVSWEDEDCQCWRFPKIGGPPNRRFLNKPSSYWGTPISGNLHIWKNETCSKTTSSVNPSFANWKLQRLGLVPRGLGRKGFQVEARRQDALGQGQGVSPWRPDVGSIVPWRIPKSWSPPLKGRKPPDCSWRSGLGNY